MDQLYTSGKKVERGRYGLRRFHRPRLLSFLMFSWVVLSVSVSAQPTGTSSFNSVASSSSITSSDSVAQTTIPSSITPPRSTASDVTSTNIVSQATPSSVTIPQPFDTAQLGNVGSNFTTSSCPTFMRTFLADPQFQACVPFSFLLYTSAGFFSLTRAVSPMQGDRADHRGRLLLLRSLMRHVLPVPRLVAH